MARFDSVKFLGKLAGGMAAASLLSFLTACGGSSSSSKTTGVISESLSQYSSSYAGAINDFTSDPSRHVQALMFPVLTSSSPIYSSFMSNVLPNISGVSVSLQWSQIETSQGVYDFSSFDASLAPYIAAGKQVNLIVWPATEGGSNDPSNGGSTPAYIFTQAWATTVGAPNPQDMTVCQSYPGDTTNPYYSQTQSGGGGIWNISTQITGSSDLSGLPVSYELPFMVGYENFIQVVIAHYNQASSPKIGYIRFGFSQGGENSPECNQFWPNFSQTQYVTDYIQPMSDFVKAQNPTMTILQDLHSLGQLSSEGAAAYVAYPDQEASIGVADGFGIGTNGLQQSDATASASQPCDSDWCSLFAMYHTDFNNASNITLSLQTLQWTDPTNAAQTGSLTVLEPIAKANFANNLELYLADVGLAYDLNNYCSYPHNACSSLNGGDQSPVK